MKTQRKVSKTLIATGIALALGYKSAFAVSVNGIYGSTAFTTNHANFTMLTAGGATVGGTNDVNLTWDGNAFTDSSDYTGPGSYSNVTAVSTTSFFIPGAAGLWTAHDIQMFVPGTYSFDTTLGGGNGESGMMNATVGAGQLGMHMLFDWNGNFNIDMFIVFSQDSVFGSGFVRSAAGTTYSGLNSCQMGTIKNCLWDGSTTVSGFEPTANQVWMLASVDGNGDGVMGIPMAANGPFAGFNASFNANLDLIGRVDDCGGNDICLPPVPIPAAAWLFGSGLLGLVGVARKHQ